MHIPHVHYSAVSVYMYLTLCSTPKKLRGLLGPGEGQASIPMNL